MAHFTDLHPDLQTALGKLVPAVCSVRVELDNSQETWVISDYLDGQRPLRVRKSKSIFPYSKMGRVTIPEVNLDFINKDDFFNPNYRKSGLPDDTQFIYFVSTLYADKASGDSYVDITKDDGGNYVSGDYINVDDGDNIYTYDIISVDTSDPEFDRLNLSTSGSTAFAAGAIVESLYLPGSEVTLKTTVSGEDEKLTQFTGYMKEYPRLGESSARMTLVDKLKRILEVNITANETRVVTGYGPGNISSTVTYTRSGSSTATFDDTEITITEGSCPIGDWQIEFIDHDENFIVTDPEGEKTAGDTSTVTYIKPSPYWLYIAAAAFSGTFEKGDKIFFKTVLTLSKAYSATIDTIPDFIYKLLTENYGAGLSTADLVDASFTDLITEYDEMLGGISFTRATTVLNALEILQQHINATIYTDVNGKIDIHAYRPVYSSGGYNTISQDTDLMSVRQEDPGRVDRVVVRYAYDYSDFKFKKEIRIPDSTSAGRAEVVIELPAYYEEPQAKAVAERVWAMWRKGMRLYEIRQKWNYGLGVEISDIFQFSSDNPQLSNKVVEVYSVEKDLINLQVKILAYDIDQLFNDYLFLDVSQKLDDGLKCW